ncbi:MAG TPA: hypothetical protein VGJ43_14155 [Acidimicrobiales bacterium]|jgi:hypothetical protein
MLGAVLIVIALVVVIPVGVLVLCGAIAAGLGWSLKADGEARNEGSELVALNR